MFVDFGFKSPIAALESLKIVLKTDDRFDASQKYLIAGSFFVLFSDASEGPMYSHIRISSPRRGKNRSNARA